MAPPPTPPTTTTTFADWRAQVDKELAGASFDRLVTQTPEGLPIQPLYVDGPVPVAATRGTPHAFGVCMRVPRGDLAALRDDLDGGADAVWIESGDDAAASAAVAANHLVIIEVGSQRPLDALTWAATRSALSRGLLACDPISAVVRGEQMAAELATHLAELHSVARDLASQKPAVRSACVSTLAVHEAGADAADELALALSTAVALLRAKVPARQLWLQVAVGRDTFGEVCKLRALRLCMAKVLAAAGVPDAAPPLHAVCSTRTMADHDPWTNMLRVTTQIFAAALGGADLITPLPFDASPGPASAHGRRVARNAALVLREESHLGRVSDPAGGSYYIESRTDALAREAWSRFQAIEAAGGIVALLASGALHARLAASWTRRAAAIARRREPIVGVSEFANLSESLPGDAVKSVNSAALTNLTASPAHRDAEAFDALRARKLATTVALVTLGPASEHRGRVGFATALLATAGLRASETAEPVAVDVAVLCGSDERYATEAAAMAERLRAAGCKHVVLAGKPGALEAPLRAAGVDQFVFVGCDVLAVLEEITR